MGEFAKQRALVFHDQRHGEVDVEPLSPYQLKEAESVAPSGAQPGQKDIGVDDDLRLWHGGTIYNTTIIGNRVVRGRTLRITGWQRSAAELPVRVDAVVRPAVLLQIST